MKPTTGYSWPMPVPHQSCQTGRRPEVRVISNELHTTSHLRLGPLCPLPIPGSSQGPLSYLPCFSPPPSRPWWPIRPILPAPVVLPIQRPADDDSPGPLPGPRWMAPGPRLVMRWEMGLRLEVAPLGEDMWVGGWQDWISHRSSNSSSPCRGAAPERGPAPGPWPHHDLFAGKSCLSLASS